MEERPRIVLPLSRFDKTLEVAGIVLLMILWAGTLYAFNTLPGTIPIHFGLTGKPDAYGEKISLVILAGIASLIYLGLSMLNRIPHHFNYLTKINAANASRQYRFATRFIRYIKVATVLLFNVIVLFSWLTATARVDGLGSWFLPGVLVLFLLPAAWAVWYSTKER